MSRLMGLLGLLVLLGIAWALSNNRRRFPLRTVLWGLGLQFAFAIVILRTIWGRAVFDAFEQAFNRLISFSDKGAQFVFGDWGVPVKAFNAVTGEPHAIGFLLAFKVLPVIIFFASLMGVKISLNEMIAYQKLMAVKDQLSERSVTIATYALCGFANFGSMAIQIGGVSALVPEQRGELSRLSLRALAGGSLATFMTACIAGILL